MAGLCTLPLGVLLVARGVHHRRHPRRLLTTVATVVRWTGGFDGNGPRLMPVLRFQDHAGRVREGSPRYYWTPFLPPRSDQKVAVSYDVDQPGWWVVGDRAPGLTMFFVAGGALITMGACLLLAGTLVAVLA